MKECRLAWLQHFPIIPVQRTTRKLVHDELHKSQNLNFLFAEIKFELNARSAILAKTWAVHCNGGPRHLAP